MEEGKWWAYDDFFVGESGSDFALSRVRAAFERINKEPSAETLAECARNVARDVSGNEHVECLEAQLLFASPDEVAIVGGDGGILRRKVDACVGHGATVLMAYLLDRLPSPSKRTFSNVSKIVRVGLTHTARYCDSVCDPFFEDVAG